mmetsp:Transcript_5037/g.10993  ORF Transcript_5037/g.10993 Transcript_5037/m.10993 type:complete len:90 (+) Transcript_5037:37-306(+)
MVISALVILRDGDCAEATPKSSCRGGGTVVAKAWKSTKSRPHARKEMVACKAREEEAFCRAKLARSLSKRRCHDGFDLEGDDDNGDDWW